MVFFKLNRNRFFFPSPFLLQIVVQFYTLIYLVILYSELLSSPPLGITLLSPDPVLVDNP
jgi:hypothetical protein